MKKEISFLAIMILFVLSCLVYPEDTISAVFPDDALVYLRAENMVSLIDSYVASDFGRNYLETAAFRDFADSKLYLKLSERISNWERLTGFNLHINNVREFAGNESAAAVYDIGELHILFATTVTYPQISKSGLFKLKSSFEAKKKDGIEYYVKQSPEFSETFAFGYIKNILLIATDVSLFEKAIDIAKGKSSATLNNYDKFKKATEGLEGDLTLFADIGKLTSNTYFRSYWIYRNISALKWIEFAGGSLKFKSCGAEEKRNYIPFAGANPRLEALNNNGLARFIPQDYDFFLLTTAVDKEQIADDILTGAWGLPIPKGSGEARAEKDTKLIELHKALMDFVKKSNPSEKLELVYSEIAGDPFSSTIATPILINTSNINEDELKNILRKTGGWLSNRISFKESLEYPIKTTVQNGWKFLYLETPPLIPSTFTIGYTTNGVVFLRGDRNLAKFASSNPAVAVDAGIVSFSKFAFSQTGEKFFKTFDLLKDAPGWHSTGIKGLFSENLRSIYKILGSIAEITVEDRLEGNKMVRKVVYSCKR